MCICVIPLSATQSCKLARHRLPLTEPEGHLNKINTLGLGYTNVSPTQALAMVKGFHTDAIDHSDCQLTAQRGTGDKTCSLAYFRHSGRTIVFPPSIFFPLLWQPLYDGQKLLPQKLNSYTTPYVSHTFT